MGFHKGDKVKWNSQQGEIHGTVVKTVTEETKILGHTAKATKENPQIMVQSSKTGRRACHKPEALTRE